MCVIDRPEASILCCSSSGDNFGNKNSRVITNMWIIRPSSYAEAQPRVSLQPQKGAFITLFYYKKQKNKMYTIQMNTGPAAVSCSCCFYNAFLCH